MNLKFPDIYKDPYHKPEMAITLGEFEALSNFAPFEEIQFFLNNIETLKNIFPEQIIFDFESSKNVKILF